MKPKVEVHIIWNQSIAFLSLRKQTLKLTLEL